MTDYERIEKVIRYLERHYVEQPPLAKLASVAGLSESHFHRLFVRWAGTTPKDFTKFLTIAHARKLLAESRDLLTASFEAGLSGPGRLHDLFVSVEAMTPGEFKAQGSGVEITYGVCESPFGRCLIASTPKGICHLAFLDGAESEAVQVLTGKWPNAIFRKNSSSAKKIADAVFGKAKSRRLRVVLNGTAFQLKIWEALLRIPEGSVATYSDIAKLIGSPRSSRAVGNAVGRNSIAYLIPCHRVIRESGDFGAYRWGSARKRGVLAWEAAQAAGALESTG